MTKLLVHILSVLTTCFIVVNTIESQSIANPPLYTSDIQFFTIKDGLSHKTVHTGIQDSRGVLWLGTQNGLNRFDGKNFKVFTSEDGLPQNNINEIFRLGDQLWCIHHDPNGYGTYSRVSVFQTIEERIIPFENFSLPFLEEDIAFIKENIQGESLSIYLKERKGIYKLNKDRTVEELFMSPQNIISLGKPSRDHILYSGGSNYFFQKIDKSGKEIFTIQPDFLKSIINLDVWDYLPNDEMLMYFFNESEEGLFRLDKTGGIHHWDAHKKLLSKIYPNKLVPIASWKIKYLKKYNAIAFVHQGVFFIQKMNGELIHLTYLEGEENAFHFVGTDEINDVFWISNGTGVYQIALNKNNFKNYLADQNLASFRDVTANEEYLFFNSYSGTFQMSKQEKTTTKIHENGVAGILDKANNYWIAGNPALVKLNLETKKADFIDVPISQEIWSFYLDNQNRLWYSWHGLNAYNIQDQSVEAVEYNDFKELKEHPIYHFYDKKNGNILLCARSGLYEWNIQKGIIARYWIDGEGEFKLPTSDIRHLYFDEKDNSYWLATGDKGLVHWQPATAESKVYKLHRFQSNTVHSIYADDYNYLWMSTENGIFQFNKSAEFFRAYMPSNGTSTHEFNRISHFQDDDGTIYFGSINGITSFHPKDFAKANEENEKVEIVILDVNQYLAESSSLENVTTEFYQKQKIQMRSGDRFFTLRLTLNNYKHTTDVHYYYRIKNVDKAWTISENNEISVSGIPYGNRILEIKASLNNGQFSETLEVPVRVLRPFYLTWWFWLLIAFIGTGLTFFIIHWRTQQLQAQQMYLEKEVAKQTATIQEQAEELRILDQTKSRFFANVSHELRTPITLIQGPIQSALSSQKLDNRNFTLLAKAEQNTKKLLKLVNEILDLTKLEANKLELDESKTVFYIYLRRIISSFQSIADRKNIELSFEYEPTRELQIKLDTDKFEKIINNLLSNALKFTPKEGQIAVVVKDEGKNLLVKVKDTGRGIPTQDLPNIFNRFYQSSINKKAEGGLGIGLALSMEFVKLMNGKMWAESDPDSYRDGKGSTFFLQFPKKEVMTILSTEDKEQLPVARYQLPVSSSKQATGNGQRATGNHRQVGTGSQLETILLVEDNHDLREYVQSLLEPYYNIITAENGREALEQLKTQNSKLKTSLILSDIMMPIMDGYELLKQLKTNLKWKNIPVIMLTARAEHQDKLKALRIGVDDYLLKPFNEEELLVRIKNLLTNYEERKAFVELEIEEATVEKTTISEVETEWLEKVEELIIENISSSLFSVDYLAELLDIHRRKLYRKIKSLTGLTPNQYIRTIRLKMAKDLLEQQSCKSVKEVAAKVGFTKSDYFSTLYKKEFGKSPVEFFV